MAVKAVVFDVGETLVDETRVWAAVTRDLGVTLPTLLGVLGATIERGEHHREAFHAIGAGREPDWPEYEPRDLYPDAVPCLERLRAEGYALAVAGNQPWSLDGLFGGLVDHVLTAATVGASKPDPAFFAAILDAVGAEPAQIAYVGDRVDNDVDPALDAGLVAVHIRRGPWGHVQRGRERAHARIDSLAELPEALRAL